MLKQIIPIFLVFVLSACGGLQFPGVYKIDIQQGNILDPRKVSQLKLGMSKDQVRYLLGQPLVIDTFNPDIWNYFYHLKRGNGETKSDQLKLIFKDEKLSEMSGTAIAKAEKAKQLEEKMAQAQKQAKAEDKQP